MSSKRPASARPDESSKRRKLGHVSDDLATSQSPVRLSSETKEQLCQWLDEQERKAAGPIFKTAVSRRNGAKRKNNISTQALYLDGDVRLTSRYTITPEKKWLQLQKFKRFTVAGETHETGSCVLVKHSDDNHSFDHQGHWKALVHEVRALDENHVYLRVTWLENPQDLPGGRRPYHGHGELIPSNRMDVIDAMTVNGGIEVKHWDDADDEADVPGGDDFFWRQTFDCESGRFSELRPICSCATPHNPDELILQCTNSECRQWLHSRCLEEDAVGRANESAPTEDEPGQPAADEEIAENGTPKSGKRRKSKGKTKSETPAAESPGPGRFEAKLVVEGDNVPKIMITDRVDEKPTEGKVHCLICREIVV